ncbi:hypothetical protein [Prevotella sp.]|uniref:hypothetical protein n=1 Tax=Prevotella sp. TaxID=59823 RepID=UPI001CB3E3A4|nr:hypothetical protein [Prevotella sp.]MBF1640743.1 hypothetical protein [Prevotella sp.]
MATISGNNKAMYKIFVMAEALEKCDEVYGNTAKLQLAMCKKSMDMEDNRQRKMREVSVLRGGKL